MGVITKSSRFEFLADKIYSNLIRGEFELALAHYNKFESAFGLLRSEKKAELQAKHDLVKNCLLMYLNSSDIIKYSNSWDLEEMKERLDRLEQIMKENVRRPAKLKNVVSDNYERGKRTFNYRLTKVKFDALINEIDKLVDEENFDFALDKFKELVAVEKELNSFTSGEDVKLKRLLSGIKDHLEFSYLESLAHSVPAKYSRVKKSKKTASKNNVLKRSILEKGEGSDDYSKLRDHILTGDVEEIERLRSKLDQ